ncbi:uncharacterized protein LOC113233248 [Hyposmocoma kahamanoa]|uniref:uncharacterized protein LOC113233248 n=1 Tax=Hyposmocoma kahamanoa TaxID=1477025 RepID=UPI000E6DA33D|nr:uncharacterized protein LOC113233248 [Hyposmocoma kahamanoa]
MLTVVGFVAALPVENVGVAEAERDVAPRNTIIENIILDIIENLRDLMINGSDDIPVLDPLKLDRVYLQLDNLGLENSHIEATDLVVTGLSTFEIDDFSFTPAPTVLQPLRHAVVLDAYIPVIDIDAKNYDLSVIVVGFTIFGNGEAKLKVVEPRLKLNMMVNLGLIGGISLRILSAEARIGLVAFESGLTGVFNDDYLNDFINDFLGVFIPEVVEFFEDDISAIISPLIVQIGNDILDNIDIGDLLPTDEITKLAGLPVAENTIA